jgi:hypothetical protein
MGLSDRLQPGTGALRGLACAGKDPKLFFDGDPRAIEAAKTIWRGALESRLAGVGAVARSVSEAVLDLKFGSAFTVFFVERSRARNGANQPWSTRTTTPN